MNDTKRYDQAAACLPPELRKPILALDADLRCQVEEIRLRCGYPPTVVLGADEVFVSDIPVAPRHLELLMQAATGASAHTALDRVRSGFVTLTGGHRLGFTGRAVVKDGEVINYRELSSAALRICREQLGVAEPLMQQLYPDGQVVSTLIISPPGCGKTTLLRDLIRCASDGIRVTACRVSVVDERGELAAMQQGVPQLSVGRRTDVMEGCPKAQGTLAMLRAMNPQVIAVDEISTPQDAEAMLMAANCGAELFATAHARSLEDLKRRSAYRPLWNEQIFRRIILITRTGQQRRYQILETGGTSC